MSNNAKNIRRCIVCREHCDKQDMIRFVKDEDGNVIIDDTKKRDGRGCWVHNSDECISKLIKKRMLNAVFKKDVGNAIYEDINVRRQD